MVKLEHWIEWGPAYDKRDPDPSKNYGIGSVTMTWYVRGEGGAVQFQVMTGWYLPELALPKEPMPSDLGYHSLFPQYDGQEPLRRECPVLGGRPCYYDGSTLSAQRVFNLLVTAGGDAVWNYLDEYYAQLFGGS